MLLIGAFAALLCLGPSSAPAGASGTTPAPPAAPVGACHVDTELKVGDTGAGVICLQYALGMLHLASEPITGVFDQATSDSVHFFQQSHPPLRVDGQAGLRTLDALGIYSGNIAGVVSVRCKADATIDPGEVSPSVKCLQDSLRDLGLYNGKTTGVDDFATVDALKQYQSETPPLHVDGFAGPRTLAALGIWSGNNGLVAAGPGGNSTYIGSNIPAPPGPWPAGFQNEPLWNLTADGIPYYSNHVPCSRPDADMIAYQFAKDGADVTTQQWAVYIASREGGCRFDAVNINPATLDDSHCSFQLNALSGMFSPTGSLGRLGWTTDSVKTSMQACADAASDLWVYCGRGPWTPPYSCRPPWKDASTPGLDPNAPITDGNGSDG